MNLLINERRINEKIYKDKWRVNNSTRSAVVVVNLWWSNHEGRGAVTSGKGSNDYDDVDIDDGL